MCMYDCEARLMLYGTGSDGRSDTMSELKIGQLQQITTIKDPYSGIHWVPSISSNRVLKYSESIT